MRHLFIAALLPLLSSAIGFGQVNESLLFEITTDARGAALGSSVLADLEGDVHGAAYNPNLIDSTKWGVIALDYVDYFAGMGLASVNYQIQPKGKWRRQVGVRFLSLGEFTGADASGNPAPNFNGGENIAFYGTSRNLDSTWQFGIQAFTGTRSLDREVATWTGLECFINGTWPERNTAVAVGVTGWGKQWGWKGSQPSGWLPWNLQVALTKGFDNAPFQLFLKGQHLETWDLAPPGTYDDSIDPITGETIENTTFKLGDQFLRHITLGTAIALGDNMTFWTGFDYRRRIELMATDRLSANGISFGTHFALGQFELRISRSRYHFAGASTQLGLQFNPSQFKRQ